MGRGRAEASLALIEVSAVLVGRKDWAGRIVEAWRASVQGTLRCGRLLFEAKAELPHGEFLSMVESDLPFGKRTAQRLMAIAQHPILANATHVSLLPSSWGTLYELTKLPAPVLEQAFTDGTVRPDMQRSDVAGLIRERKREEIRARLSGEVETRFRPTTPTDRVVIVHRTNKNTAGAWVWEIKTGPNQAGVDLPSRMEALKATPEYTAKYSRVDAMRKRVAELRAEADKLQKAAGEAIGQITQDMRLDLEREHGPAYLYTETVSFWRVDDELTARLPMMSLDEQIDALYAQADPANMSKGWWGDIRLGGLSANGPFVGAREQ